MKLFITGIIMEKHKKKPISWAEFARISIKNQQSKYWLINVKLCLTGHAELTCVHQEDLYKVEGKFSRTSKDFEGHSQRRGSWTHSKRSREEEGHQGHHRIDEVGGFEATLTSTALESRSNIVKLVLLGGTCNLLQIVLS